MKADSLFEPLVALPVGSSAGCPLFREGVTLVQQSRATLAKLLRFGAASITSSSFARFRHTGIFFGSQVAARASREACTAPWPRLPRPDSAFPK